MVCEFMSAFVRWLTYFAFLGASQDKRGKLVEWVEKVSFDRLNRLFEIAAAERSCETLLFAQNLRSVTQEP